MLICAHRGFHDVEPENTIAAFRRALDIGVDGIETDVRLSADGQLILFHDRFTPDGLSVGLRTRKQLSHAVGYEVPTVDEAFGMAPEIFWNFEIKSSEAVEPLQKFLSRVKQRDNILVSSFMHADMIRFSQRSKVRCGLLIAHNPTEDEARLITRTIKSPRVMMVMDFESITESTIEMFDHFDTQTMVFNISKYSVNDPILKGKCFGVITDDAYDFLTAPCVLNKSENFKNV